MCLAVPDETALAELATAAQRAGLRLTRVHEPDLGGALTGVALEPAARRLVRRLPLALRPTSDVSTSDLLSGGGENHDY